jgi:formylglycine-generating enzyme required for sulfatase activity
MAPLMRVFAAFSLLFASTGSLVVLIVIGVPYAASFILPNDRGETSCILGEERWLCGLYQLQDVVLTQTATWSGLGGVAAVVGLLAVYIGAGLVRVLARATPLAADGQRRWATILTLVAFLLFAVMPIWFAYLSELNPVEFETGISEEDAHGVTLGDLPGKMFLLSFLVNISVFAILVGIIPICWQLYRHIFPEGSKGVLFLRRFGGVGDSVLTSGVARALPGSSRLTLIATPSFRPSSWDIVVLVFGTLRLFRPWRGIPRFLKTSDATWKENVRRQIAMADAVVLDRSEPSASMDAEVDMVHAEHANHRTLWLRRAGSPPVEGRSEETATTVVYDLSWSDALPRIAAGILTFGSAGYLVGGYIGAAVYLIPAAALFLRPSLNRASKANILKSLRNLLSNSKDALGRLETVRALQFDAAKWKRNAQDRAYLNHRGGRLAETEVLATNAEFAARLGDDERAYLTACRAEERAMQVRAKREKALVGILVVGLVVGIGTWWQEGAKIRAFAYRVTTVRDHKLTEADEQKLKPGDVFSECAKIWSSDQTTHRVSKYCPDMIVVPAGEFMMGSQENMDEKLHSVTIAKPFAVSKFAVTFDQWDSCVAAGGCEGYQPSDRDWGRGTRPVINVNWADAQRYVDWLNKMRGKNRYRLLSEAEFEYAARAGSTTAYPWGDDIGEGNANCKGCGGPWDGKQTAPVGSFKPNAFGLYDMHGNGEQWVQDCFRDYAQAPSDGNALESGNCDFRVLRGGGWRHVPQAIRSAKRSYAEQGVRRRGVGLRVARTL